MILSSAVLKCKGCAAASLLHIWLQQLGCISAPCLQHCTTPTTASTDVPKREKMNPNHLPEHKVAADACKCLCQGSTVQPQTAAANAPASAAVKCSTHVMVQSVGIIKDLSHSHPAMGKLSTARRQRPRKSYSPRSWAAALAFQQLPHLCWALGMIQHWRRTQRSKQEGRDGCRARGRADLTAGACSSTCPAPAEIRK